MCAILNAEMCAVLYFQLYGPHWSYIGGRWGVEPIAQNGIFYQPNINSEGTLLSQTLKVQENKVPSEFSICQSQAEYLALINQLS
jgi:hypothetical protein